VVISAALLFVVVINTYRNPHQIKRLLVTIIVIGAAAAVLALAQDITRATHIFWIGPAGRGLANAGPFLAYSHYGQFMNLSMGAGMGLLLVELYKTLNRPDSAGATPLKPWYDKKR